LHLEPDGGLNLVLIHFDPNQPRAVDGKWTSGAGGFSKSEARAFDGARRELKTTLSKLETGELGEPQGPHRRARGRDRGDREIAAERADRSYDARQGRSKFACTTAR
jgi:hypothetical protein